MTLDNLPPPDNSKPASSTADGSRPTHSRKLKILLAEDDPVSSLLASNLIQQLGHDVSVATNGTEAVAAVEKETFDLVLMDFHMPFMDGLEATRQIRELETLRPTRATIIVLTAGPVDELLEDCLAAGTDGCLPKPLRKGELMAAIARFIPSTDEPAPPPTEATTGPTAFNRAKLLNELGDNVELLRKITEVFFETTPALMQRIRTAVQATDAKSLEAAAHTLKGSLGQLVALEAGEAANTLERLGREENLSDAPVALARLEKAMERFDHDMHEWLNEL